MKYTISNLMATTLVVAIMCAIGRFFGVNDALGILLIIGFLLAPSGLAFLLAPFRSVSSVQRRHWTLGILAVLGVPATIVAAVFVSPALGAFVGLFALSIWVPQLALLNELHSG